MKIELKNFRYYPRLSDDTNAFSADLFINGVNCGHTENSGQGGPCSYGAGTPEGRRLIAQAEAWCQTLPPWLSSFTNEDGKPMEISRTLENYIDDLADTKIEEKEKARLQRQMEKQMYAAIIFGIPDKYYKSVRLKFSIDYLLARPDGAEALTKFIREKIIPQMEKGEVILNTNLPEELLPPTHRKPLHNAPERPAPNSKTRKRAR